MASHIERRKFLATLGGAAAAWPLAARAQQPAVPVIGFLRDASLANFTHVVVAFRQGLKEAGFIQSQNVAIEYRSAEDQADRLPVLVADLLRQQVALIVGNTASALAAKFNSGGTNRVRDRRRPGHAGLRRQPQPTGR